MNRFLALAVVALMTVGAAGCATGVEDPQPPPPTPTKSNPPPPQTFANEDVDTSVPDKAKIGTGVEAPKPDLEVEPPIPTNGDPIDPNLESDSPDLDPSQYEQPVQVKG